MAELLVVTGPPGVGKSTVARVLVGGFDPSALVLGDEFFGFINRRHLVTDPPSAPEETAARLRDLVAAGSLICGPR